MLATLRDQPRAETAVRRRRLIAAGLWIAAPSAWLGRFFVTGPDVPLLPIEFVVYLASSALLCVSAVGLDLRPALARGFALAAVVLVVGGLALRAPASPPAAFVALAAAALLGLGLVTMEMEHLPDLPRELTGTLWSPAVLGASTLALVIAGLAQADLVAPPHLIGWLIAVILAAASGVALLAERDLYTNGQLSRRRFAFGASLTVTGAIAAPFSPFGQAALVLRLLFAITWASRERRLRTDLLGLARLRPGQVAFVSFGLSAVGGAMLLALPISSTQPEGIGLLDALFTATSAVCVTGLAVVDTATELSRTGQAIVLILIQVGGLGIMTLSAIITFAIGRTLTGGAEQALGETIGARSTPAAVMRTIRTIAIGTITTELAGAVALLLLTRDRFEGLGDAAWFAVFTSISAFCNAGFALYSDSMTEFAGDPAVLHVICTLIIFGGAGFGVLNGVFASMRHTATRSTGRRPASDLNVKLALTTSAVLLAIGFVATSALEWEGLLAPLPLADKLHNAWFQSVTLRTAGFNSIPIGESAPPAIIVMLLLMFIGATPGSTGGGIKTTTAAVLFLAIRNVFSRRPEVEAFGRRIDPEVVQRATAVTLLSFGTVLLGAFLLTLTQDAPFEQLLFEATSAVGTVGLSMGATGLLDDSGKVIVVALMFLGRVGPLTAAAILQSETRVNHRFPKGEVSVG